MHACRPVIALAVIVLCLAAVAAEEADAPFWGITDPLAQPAIRRWTQAEQRAHQQYEKAVQAANQHLRHDLLELQPRLIDTGRLEEAIKVRTALDDLVQGKTPNVPERQEAQEDDPMLLRPPLARKLHNTVWRHRDGWTVTFNAADMSLTSSAHRRQGTWAVVTRDTIRCSPHRLHCQGYLMKINREGTAMIEPNGTTWTLVSKP